MDNERIREICMAMPHVCETVNWGHHLVYFVGDRDIGGKMFALIDLDDGKLHGGAVISYAAGPERFNELLEVEGIIASPYLVKVHWVTVERWDVLRPRQIEDELKRGYELIYAKLSPRTKKILLLPEKERVKVIRERKKVLKAKGKQR